MRELPDLIACEGCDAVYQKRALQHREVAVCLRCGAELERDFTHTRARILPLSVAGLIMFIIANAFPIVQIELQGLHNQTTLFGAVLALYKEGMSLVAFLVLATTIFSPMMQLVILIYVLIPRTSAERPPGFGWLVRAMQTLRPWGMIEVFLLGVLVAIVKLSNMATVLPGTALWAFAALTILLTAIISFDPRYLWQITPPTLQDKNP
ncbi:paraquat-inducible protein A [Glaciimonas immobilis]|uniref:Paraquat-inducible protein A n=1 Tax=Glaciimonas immobilis TaxID=728004 RepID=A0A840S055_9BURK|nr:paraquat-inducible protein A [Glaciimonas immobilis]KAF3998351.1 paraquat-inducible protein A [Glaciimonas immobilis]MBB5201979.1 paraquat-inducible protein A [Glaciimonas immobilis]